MKPVVTIFDPKKVIRNKQCYLTNLYSPENTEETFISRKSFIYKDPAKDFTCLNKSFPPVGIFLERMITMSYFTSKKKTKCQYLK